MARNHFGTSLCSSVNSTLEIILTGDDGKAIFAKCLGTPPTTAGLFEHGCIILQTDSGLLIPALYQNNGSTASPSWVLSGSAATGVGGISTGYGASGAIDPTKTVITVATTAGAVALTLADGVEGKLLFVSMTADDGNNAVITPANLINGTTVTFNDVGDSAFLFMTAAGWAFMGGTATLA